MGGILSAFQGQPDQYQASSPYAQSYGQNAANNQATTLANQQGLASVLAAQMNGAGPNPSQTQYLGNVQNNIANSQGLIASQRGLNPALAARMGANAATTANQQGSMGSALLQQQQQLAAQGQLQNLYAQQQAANLQQQQIYGQGVQGANSLNAGAAQQNAQTSTQLAGGLLSGLSTGATLGLMGGLGGGGAAAAGGGAAMPAASSLQMPTFGSSLGYSDGGKVPGKAMVDGDSETNDSVHAMLSPGEIVVPRSKSHDPEKAKAFIDHLIKNDGKKEKTYGDVLEARRKKAT